MAENNEHPDIVERDDVVADVHAAIAQLDKADSPSDPSQSIAPEGESASDAAERLRNERGQFVKQADKPEIKPAAGAAPAKAAPAQDTKSPAQEDNAAAQAGTVQPVASPPPGWSPAAKATWASLSPAVQAAVLKREKEVSDGFAQKTSELRPWKDLEQVIAPRRGQYQKFGFKSDAEAINHLLSFSDAFDRDPISTLAHLAQSKGIDLGQLGNGQNNGTFAQPQQFHQQPAQPALDINSAVREALQEESAKQEIETFKADAAKYPHFEDLKELMAQFLYSGKSADLSTAYEDALWATPHLRSEAIAARMSNQQQQTSSAKQQRVKSAQQATRASLTGAPHGSPVRPPSKSNGSFDDVVADVRAAVEQHAG